MSYAPIERRSSRWLPQSASDPRRPSSKGETPTLRALEITQYPFRYFPMKTPWVVWQKDARELAANAMSVE
jgi:hypothetical protein